MRRLICLLLILTTLVSLTACGGNPPEPPIGPPGDTVVIENADLLAYSFDRIENADLSFNMSMNGVETASDTSAAPSSITACGSGDTVVIENPNELAWSDFFESDRTLLEQIRSDSRRLCDFILEKVTVVNKIVHDSGMNYLLQYEGDGDVLTVYSFSGGVDGDALEKKEEGSVDGAPIKGDKDTGGVDPIEAAFSGKVRDLVRIQFSYDEDGDETVSYFNYSINYEEYSDSFFINSMEVIYTPGKHYEIKSYSCGVDKTTLAKTADADFMHATVADHATGKWQGISWSGSSSHPYFTKEGNYDVNQGVGISFIFETDEGLMQISGKLQAYRDGDEIHHGECLATDEVYLKINSMTSEMFWLQFEERGFSFSLSLANLNGWDRVVLDRGDEIDPYHIYLRGDDYIEFSNGKKLYGSETNNSMWIDGVGFVHIRFVNEDTGDVEYIDEAGEAHDSEWFVANGGDDYSRQLQFNGETYLDPTGESTPTFMIVADIITNVDNPEVTVCDDPFGLLEKFFDCVGLSSKLQPDTDKTFAAIVGVYENREQYMDALFRDWNGVNFDYGTFVDYIFDSFEERCTHLTAYNGFAAKHEAVDISMIPELPANFALITISNGVSGEVAVSEAGIDFSAISVAVAKNILLGDQNEYGVAAVLVGKGENGLAGAFEVKTYANEDMTLLGKAGIALPTNLPEGSYTLSLYFGRKTEGGFARLSEVIVPTVSSFTAFSKRIDTADGYYTYAYSVINGALRLSVTFTDTAVPAISLTGSSVEGENLVMALSAGATVSDLIANAIATDNRDGSIILTSQNVLLMNTSDGSPLGATDALINGATYKITVKDSSGNEAFVNVKIKLN